MDLSLPSLLAAFGGGLFGAAIGAIPAFVFCGIAVLLGVVGAIAGAPFDVLGLVGFGPIFGPHVAFAGGVAAAAYAGRRRELDDGKDVLAPLAGLATADVLVVGGVFGTLGHVLEQLLETGIGEYTDVVALVVVVSGVIARFAFGRTGLGGSPTEEARSRGRFTPGGANVWAAYQQDFPQAALLGLGTGLLSAWLALEIVAAAPEAELAATTVGFGISAFSLLFLVIGTSAPITHHMTITAAVGALATGSVLVGALVGAFAAVVGEASSRLMLIHGDTHIDPPANAIWIVTSIVLLVELAVETVV